MRTYGRCGSPTLTLTLLVASLAAGIEGQVQVKVLEDGTKLIYNESQVQRARRTADRLLPVPSAEIDRLIDHHARRQGLSPRLVQAVVQVESGYNPKALSRKGAMGLMQLMPETARELRVSNPYDPEQNIRAGTTYLRQMLGRFGRLEHSLAAYNAGPTAVERHRGVPPFKETRNYVTKVLRLYHGDSSLPPSFVREHARDLTQKHEDEAQATAEAERGGDPVFVTRDASGRIVVSTSPSSN